MVGKVDGTLTWGGKDIERVNAKSIGTTGYIRYESGLQICWEQRSSVTSSGIEITFPIAFNANPKVVAVSFANLVALVVYDVSTTSFYAKTDGVTPLFP